MKILSSHTCKTSEEFMQSVIIVGCQHCGFSAVFPLPETVEV